MLYTFSADVRLGLFTQENAKIERFSERRDCFALEWRRKRGLEKLLFLRDPNF